MTLGLPSRTMRALRELYAAPADPAYWDALRERIVAEVAAEPAPGRKVLGVVRVAQVAAWDRAFAPWRRMGLIAAGIAIVCSAALNWRTQAIDTTTAYETVMSSTSTTPSSWLAEITGATDGGDAR